MSNSFVRVPPDGAGKRIHTTQHNIDLTDVEIQHVHISDSKTPGNSVNIDDRGAMYITYTEGQPTLDPYHNTKISTECVLGIYEFSQDSYEDLYSKILLSGGTFEYINSTSSLKLSTSSVPTSKSEIITHRHHYYQPGTFIKGIFVVSCGDLGKTNNKRLWGLYNDRNGIYFTLDGTQIGVGIRSSSTGPTVDTTVFQSNWNVDKLDGTGQSGIILDVTKSYQYFIEYNWPAGIKRFGIYDPTDGRITCHIINESGKNPVSTLQNSSLPLSFTNENYGVVGSSSELNINSAVIKSDKNACYTFWRFADLECQGKSISTNTPIISFRPKVLLDNGNHNSINSYPEILSVYSTNPIKIQLAWTTVNQLTGATWTLDSVDGPLVADSGATSIDINSDNYWITNTFYVNGTENINLTPFFELNDEGILLNGDSTNDNILSIVGTALSGGSSDVTMTLQYRGLY